MNCFLCGDGPLPSIGTARDYYISGEEFHLVGCAKCGIAHTDFTFTDDDFAKYYGGEAYYAHNDEFSKLGAREQIQRDGILLRSGQEFSVLRQVKVRLLSAFMLVSLPATSGSKILDIGCGAGKMLSAAREAGCECYGVEPSPHARGVLERHGIVAYPTVFDSRIPRNSFDVVVFNQSLEHVPDPIAAASMACALLQPGGFLIISVPNHASLESRIFGTYWRHLDVPRHLHHFSPEALAALGTKLGLELVDKRYKFWGYPTSSITLAKQLTGIGAYWRTAIYLLSQAMALVTWRKRSFGSMISFTFRKPLHRPEATSTALNP